MIKVDVFTFNPVQENTYLLSNEKGDAIIIDPGCMFSAEQDELKNFILKAGLKPVRLMNTHCHFDHVFGAKWAAATYKLEMYIHPEEEKIMQGATASAMRFGLEFENYDGPLHFLHDNDTVTLGSDELKVILAPGHSPGSICFYNEKQGFVIGGDVLFRRSIGRTDFPYGSHEQLLESIRTRLFVLPDETVIYPGHGQSTTIGYEKRNNPFLI
jgi:glyoxylase-like metal-dependent hydrolase (beta-lactamase superfamily II)